MKIIYFFLFLLFTDSGCGSNSNSGSEDNGSPRINYKLMCIKCDLNMCDVACLPCGHVSSCLKCIASLQQCPKCLERFDQLIRIYFTPPR